MSRNILWVVHNHRKSRACNPAKAHGDAVSGRPESVFPIIFQIDPNILTSKKTTCQLGVNNPNNSAVVAKTRKKRKKESQPVVWMRFVIVPQLCDEWHFYMEMKENAETKGKGLKD